MVAALAEARAHPSTREVHFVSPFALWASTEGGNQGRGLKRLPDAAFVNDFPRKGKGTKEKGGKTSKKSGAIKGGRTSRNRGGKGKWGLARNTPDGRPICFAYNNQDEECSGSCGMVHCCQKCFAMHPTYRHGEEGVDNTPAI